jgi:hypothetical protein
MRASIARDHQEHDGPCRKDSDASRGGHGWAEVHDEQTNDEYE